MADIWLEGFERVPIADRPGGRYDASDRWKACLHTTQGTTIAGAMAAYRRVPPHIVVDPDTRRRVQHIPLNRRSYSLRSTEAEDEPVVQVEIVGYAEDAPSMPDDELRWLALEVLAPIRVHCPFDLARPPRGFGGVEGYGTRGAYRMSMPEWEQFSGIVGHSHSPAPDTHWDPGDLDVDRILEHMAAALPSPPRPPTPTEEEMLSEILAAYAIGAQASGRPERAIPSPQEVDDWITALRDAEARGEDLVPFYQWIYHTVANGG